jgi:hypothetical protein
VYCSVYNKINKVLHKVKFMKLVKIYKKLNSKYFFLNWNQHSQDRSGLDITKTYLLNKNLWYFQKKNNLQFPFFWKKIQVSEVKESKYTVLVSKLNDFSKKIF